MPWPQSNSAVSEATVVLLARAGHRNSEKAGRPTCLLCAGRLRGLGLLQGPNFPWYRGQMPHLQGKGTPRTLVLRTTFRKYIVAMCAPDYPTGITQRNSCGSGQWIQELGLPVWSGGVGSQGWRRCWAGLALVPFDSPRQTGGSEDCSEDLFAKL